MAGRARLLAGLAVVISGSLAGGAAYALNDASSGGTPTALPAATTAPTGSPTPEPTQSPTPSPTPSPTASPTPSPTASPTPSPTASPTASPTPRVTVSATPAVRYYPYPAPTKTYDGLSLRATMGPQTAAAGSRFTLEAGADDGDGTIFLTDIDWGDGTHDSGEASPSSCPPYPSPTSNPGPYKPAPDSRTFSRSHVYVSAGTYRPKITVRSINADCRPHGPKSESASVTFAGSAAIHVT